MYVCMAANIHNWKLEYTLLVFRLLELQILLFVFTCQQFKFFATNDVQKLCGVQFI